MSSISSAPSATFSSTQLRALQARVNGRVFVPGDDGYDTARQTWNVTTFDQRPAIVVMPSISADVASAVSFAREHNLSIAPCLTWCSGANCSLILGTVALEPHRVPEQPVGVWHGFRFERQPTAGLVSVGGHRISALAASLVGPWGGVCRCKAPFG
jgi:hypothetical protein